MKIYIPLLTLMLTTLSAHAILGTANKSLAENVTYISGTLGYNQAFNTSEGWGREPLAAFLEVPEYMAIGLFPPGAAELSVTAQIDDEVIGSRYVNWWKKDWLEKFPLYVKATMEQYGSDKRLATYANLLHTVYSTESTELVNFFKKRNIPLETIAHNCGLIVLKKYGGLGIGNYLTISQH